MKILKCLIVLIGCIHLSAYAASLARVEAVQAQAFVERNGKQDPITNGLELQISDILTTGAGARLMIRLSDTSLVRVGANAQVKVENLTQTAEGLNGSFNVVKGFLRFTSETTTKRDVRIQVGKTVTAGIRGTDVFTNAADKQDMVCLLTAGQVSVQSGDTTIILRKPREFFVVPHGQPPLPVGLVEEEKIQRWKTETEMTATPPKAEIIPDKPVSTVAADIKAGLAPPQVVDKALQRGESASEIAVQLTKAGIKPAVAAEAVITAVPTETSEVAHAVVNAVPQSAGDVIVVVAKLANKSTTLEIASALSIRFPQSAGKMATRLVMDANFHPVEVVQALLIIVRTEENEASKEKTVNTAVPVSHLVATDLSVETASSLALNIAVAAAQAAPDSVADIAAASSRLVRPEVAIEIAPALAMINPKAALDIVRETSLAVPPNFAFLAGLRVRIVLELNFALDDSYKPEEILQSAVLPTMTPMTSSRITISPH